MSEVGGLKVVNALDLDGEIRKALQPGEPVLDDEGLQHYLPRYFYEIPDHDVAMSTRLTPHFGLNEFILADLKENPRLRTFPKYVPCAVRVLAFFLEQFRTAAGASVHIQVNGGYRSPTHQMSLKKPLNASPHMWGTAADIYRVGSTILKTRDAIEKFNHIAEDLSEVLRTLPYGHVAGQAADDHVHVDLGYITVIPREISEDLMEVPQENKPRFVFEDRRRVERRSQPAPEEGE